MKPKTIHSLPEPGPPRQGRENPLRIVPGGASEARAQVPQERRMTLLGVLFGLLFPLLGTTVECARLGLPLWDGALRVQAETPLLWIINTAPLVLGAAGYFITAPKALELGNLLSVPRLILALGLLLFVADTLANCVGLLLPGLPAWEAALIDSATMVLLTMPFLWLLVARPLCSRSIGEMLRANAVIDTSADAILTMDAIGAIRSFNPAAERIFGYAAEEVLGRGARMLLPEWERIAKERGAAREVVARRRNGEPFPAQLAISEMQWEGRRTLVGILRDSTEQKAAEEALRESEERNRTLLASLPQRIFFKNRQSVFLSVNALYAQDLGVSADQIVGKTDSDLFPEALAEKYRADDLRVLETRDTITLEETNRVGERERIIEVTKTPVVDGAGEVIGVLGVFTDVTERRQAEQALRESEARNRALVSAIPDLMFRMSREGIYRDFLAAKSEDLAAPPDRMLGRSVREVLPPEVARQAMHAIEQALETGETQVFEYALRLQDEVRAFEARVVVSGEDEAFAIVRNVTERKQVEAAHRRSEERYRAFIENSSEGIWCFDLEQPLSSDLTEDEQIEHLYRYCSLSECNDAMARMYGLSSAQELLGARLDDFLVRDTPENIEYLRTLVQSGYRLLDGESQELDKDGNPKYFLNNMVGIIEGGKLLRVWGTQRDITERKQVEEAIKESEARKGAILDTALDGIITIDDQGKITEFNPAAERTFGHRREEVLGWEMAELIIPPALRERHRAGLARLVAGGDRFAAGKRLEVTALRASGEEFPAELSITRIPVDGPPAFTGFIRDITERKRAEEEKERLQTQVIQNEKLAALGELVAGVAHEINNPLAAISGHAQLMEMHPDGQVREDAQTMRRMAERATRVVRSLLTFARGHDGERREVSVNALVEATLEVCAYKVRKADVTLELRLDENAPLVPVNDNQIQQIILNLINNAEQALRQKEGDRRIVITTGRTEPAADGAAWAAISVQDNGCGIPEEIQRRIFDPFFTTKDVGEGTGLGLSVCHGIAEAHGGHLSVASTVGVGTTFTLSLPLARPAPTES